MQWAALILWVLTAGGGFVLFAISLLLVVALLGFTMFGMWVRQRQGQAVAAHAARAASGPMEPAEQRFPAAIVGVHGLAAATTLVLVLLAALEIGTG